MLQKHGRSLRPRAKDADLWIIMCEELNNVRAKEILIEVEHVKAPSYREALTTEGSYKADELAKAGVMLDGRFMVQAGGSTIRKEKKCVQPCSLQPVCTAWWENGKIASEVDLRDQFKGRQRSIRRSGV